MNIKKLIVTAIFSLSLLLPNNVFGQRSKGSSSSSKNSNPSSKSTSSKGEAKSGSGSSKSPQQDSKKSSWGSDKSKTPPKTGSKTDQAATEKVKSHGKKFDDSPKGRASATEKFRKDNAQKYSAKFKTEPKVRPTYIPSSTLVGNQNVTIVYNSSYGGYGYMDPVMHRWMMYNALADAAMISVLMNRDGYVFANETTSTGFFSILIIALVFIALVVVIGVALDHQRRITIRQRGQQSS